MAQQQLTTHAGDGGRVVSVRPVLAHLDDSVSHITHVHGLYWVVGMLVLDSFVVRP